MREIKAYADVINRYRWLMAFRADDVKYMRHCKRKVAER